MQMPLTLVYWESKYEVENVGLFLSWCCLGTMVNLLLQQNTTSGIFLSQTTPSFMFSLCILLFVSIFTLQSWEVWPVWLIFQGCGDSWRMFMRQPGHMTVAKSEAWGSVHARPACCCHRFLSHKVLLCKTSYYTLHLQDGCWYTEGRNI